VQVSGGDDATAWLLGTLLDDGDDAPPAGAGPDVVAPPVDADVLGELAVVPPRGTGRFLVPTASPAAAARSLTAFNRLRPWRRRASRAAIAATLRIGLGGPLLSRRVVVRGRAGDATSDLADRWLVEHLRQVLGEPELLVAAGLRAGDTFAKPVLQLFRPDGTPVAYAKVGWNDVTRPRVRTEADVLAGWPTEGRGVPGVMVPRLLHAGEWAGRVVAVTAPLPADARRLRRSDPAPALAAAAVPAAGPVTTDALAASPYWKGLVDDAEHLGAGPFRSAGALRRAVEQVAAGDVDVEVRLGRWHGDWVTWNLAMADGQLWAWDWEYSDPSVPVGLDVVHHLFQESFVGRGRPAAEALVEAAVGAGELLPALGLSRSATEVTVALHRAELARRDAAAEALGADPDPRLDAAALGDPLPGR
jgi:hypothetical protein